ncbi:unnamed protein product, partial [Scytosiphon promiscuus]
EHSSTPGLQEEARHYHQCYAMEITPRRSSSTTATQMQLVLRSTASHPPPSTSLDAVVSSSSGGTASVVACELMAVSEGLDLAMLCAGNTIRAVSLTDVPDAAADPSGSITRTPSRAGQHRQQRPGGEDPFHPVSFSADCAPRPGDDVIPSDSIPPRTPIKGLEFSPSGHSLLIWGESYVAVARLPRGAARSNVNGNGSNATPIKHGGAAAAAGSGEGGDRNARWKWTLVDMSGYAVDVMKQRVVQAAWHPASDSCVTLLTVGKDDVYVAVAGVGARAFVMLHVPGRERPEQVLPVPDGPGMSPPIALAHSNCPGWQRFAVWIARRDGSVGALCPVVPQTAKVDLEELWELWSATSDTLVAARWEQEKQGGLDSERRSALDEEVLRLEQQQAWLRETFRDVFDGQDQDDTAVAAGAGALVTRPPPRHLVLQDCIVAGRINTPNGVPTTGVGKSVGGGGDGGGGGGSGSASSACGLTVLEGAGGAGRGGDTGEVAEAAPPPVVLAVGYQEGCVDIALVPSGIGPRWSHDAGKRVSCAGRAGDTAGAVLESLDLAERVYEDKSARRRKGLSLSKGAGPWTLLAATPCRLTSITVTWAGRIERAAEHARERAAQAESRTSSTRSTRLDGDLRALLRERPDSGVNEVLFVPPSTEGRIVGVVPVTSPIVGHLALARLAGGQVEMVNLAVMNLQATEVASAAKRAQAHETPGRGDMLPRFEAVLQKAVKALDERRMEEPLGSTAGHLLVSQLDRKSVKVVEGEADRLVDGGIVVLEKLHLKTNTRLETLGEVYEHQAGLVKELAREVMRLRSGREDQLDRLDEINDVADEQRARSAGVLAVVQATRPDVSPAERAFMSEMKDMENYADRQQVMMEPATKQVEELRVAEREAEDYLSETRDVWNMLQADRERILNLSRRMETARNRLAELGVRED